MSDLMRRLRDPAFGTETSERNLMNQAADRIEQLEADQRDTTEEFGRLSHDLGKALLEIERLRAENASLASWQCEFTDGKTGLVYGEGGSTFCIMAKRMQQLEAEAQTRTLDYLGQVGQLSEELERVRAALGEQVQWVKDLADSLMEAEGKIGVKNARIEQLEAALRLLHDNVVTAWPSVADLGPVANARATLEDKA